MVSALIVSSTEQGISFFRDMLDAAAIGHIAALRTCGEARRRLMEQEFDLVIINAPLRDESGESLARHIALQGFAQVILVVAGEYFDAVSAICENDGVLVVAKPLRKAAFWAALKLAKAAHSRFTRVKEENSKLKQKIEDIRIVDRAKCILISHLGMREQEAHKYIEKQAMDLRRTKRAVAESILKTYEN